MPTGARSGMTRSARRRSEAWCHFRYLCVCVGGWGVGDRGRECKSVGRANEREKKVWHTTIHTPHEQEHHAHAHAYYAHTPPTYPWTPMAKAHSTAPPSCLPAAICLAAKRCTQRIIVPAWKKRRSVKVSQRERNVVKVHTLQVRTGTKTRVFAHLKHRLTFD